MISHGYIGLTAFDVALAYRSNPEILLSVHSSLGYCVEKSFDSIRGKFLVFGVLSYLFKQTDNTDMH